MASNPESDETVALSVTPPTTPRPKSRGEEARFEPGTLVARRYRIISRLGKGGMGEVFRADDIVLGQPVALKFLPETAKNNTSFLTRFYDEVRIARQISHPNVCRVYDIGELDGHPYLSMEYIDGEDLASLLRRIGTRRTAKGMAGWDCFCAAACVQSWASVRHGLPATIRRRRRNLPHLDSGPHAVRTIRRGGNATCHQRAGRRPTHYRLLGVVRHEQLDRDCERYGGRGVGLPRFNRGTEPAGRRDGTVVHGA